MLSYNYSAFYLSIRIDVLTILESLLIQYHTGAVQAGLLAQAAPYPAAPQDLSEGFSMLSQEPLHTIETTDTLKDIFIRHSYRSLIL